MIDIHNHILIGLDDGSQSKEETLALLKQAKDEGVTDIIATPHHLSPQFDNYYEDIVPKMDEVLSIDEFKDIGINIYPGQEVRISDQILPQLENNQIIGLNHSKYLLIELPSGHVPHYTGRLFFELQSKGYVPIIAHPERNKEISANLDVLYELINAGALSQLTTASLMGHHGKKTQKKCIDMIENNLTHFVASDAHHVEKRPFIMNRLFEERKLKKYHEEIHNLMNNAKFIIDNEDVPKKQPTQEYTQKRFFNLF